MKTKHKTEPLDLTAIEKGLDDLALEAAREHIVDLIRLTRAERGLRRAQERKFRDGGAAIEAARVELRNAGGCP